MLLGHWLEVLNYRAAGIITSGRAYINESIITGGSKLASENGCDDVIADTVVVDYGLQVNVIAICDATALAGIERLIVYAATPEVALQSAENIDSSAASRSEFQQPVPDARFGLVDPTCLAKLTQSLWQRLSAGRGPVAWCAACA